MCHIANDIALTSECPFDELHFPSVDEDSIEQIEHFGRCLKHLSIGGSWSLISSIERSWLHESTKVALTLHEPIDARDDLKRADSSIFASLSTLTLHLNDTWTNDYLRSLVCASNAYAELNVDVVAGTTTLFSLPSCLSSASRPLTDVYISGILPPDLTMLTTTVTSITVLNAPTNSSTGLTTYDLNLLNNFPSLRTAIFTGCLLTGPFLTSTTAVTLNLNFNYFYGPIDPDFFVNSPGLTTLYASFNQLDGTIPNRGLNSLAYLGLSGNKFTHWPSIEATAIPQLSLLDISQNPLLVEIPNATFWEAQTRLTYVNLASCPGLSGQPVPITNPAQVYKFVFYSIAYCGFIGSLPELPETSSTTPFSRSFNFDSNQLSGTIPVSWSNYTFTSLTISDNPGITGTWPAKMFGPARREFVTSYTDSLTMLTTLDISMTSLEGPMTFSTDDYYPSYFSHGLILRAADTNFDFCSSTTSAVWNITTHLCDLSRTSAYDCQERYSGASCTFTATPTVSMPPSLAPSTCNGSPPAAEFHCIGGVWISQGSVSSPTITVPSNTPIFVEGNVSSSSLVIAGINASITIQGCVDGLQEISIVLTLQDLQRIEASKDHRFNQSVIILGDNTACANISSASLNLQGVTKNGCRTVTAQSQTSSNGGLAVIFVMSPTSSCKSKTWWIVLVSVLCSAVLIAIVVVVMLVILVPSFRARVRPYSTRDRAQQSNLK